MDKKEKANWISHAVLYAGILAYLPALKFIFLPHLDNLITETIRGELQNVKTQAFIQCLIDKSETKTLYIATIERLDTFQNIPTQQRTPFHVSEMHRLNDRKELLLGQMNANNMKTCIQ